MQRMEHAHGTSPQSVHSEQLARFCAQSGRAVSPLVLSRPSTSQSAAQGGDSSNSQRVTHSAYATPDQPTATHTAQQQCQRQLPLSVALPPRSMHVPVPGPGAYSPVTDRHGQSSGGSPCSATFGVGSRPEAAVPLSPGPAYAPVLDYRARVIGSRRPSSTAFGKQPREPCPQRNDPAWNPGPGTYAPRSHYLGGRLESGSGGPLPTFPKGPKPMPPSAYLSERHARVENAGLHSPGPCAYRPDASAVKPGPAAYSIQGRAKHAPPGEQDLRRPNVQLYDTRRRTYLGAIPMGGPPNAVFSRAQQIACPEAGVSGEPFLSALHALHSNLLVHSPGPMYDTRKGLVCSSPHLGGGPAQRLPEYN